MPPNPNKIQALVFDLGKVLLEFDYAIAMQKFLSHSAIDFAELNALLNQSQLLLDYEAGKISTDAFFSRVRTEAGYQGTFEEFSRDFSDIFEPVAEMVSMHQALKEAGWRTYLFSNTNELAVQHIKSRFPFYSAFDGHVLSYEHGCMKPEARLYEVIEDLAGCGGDSIFYIDDRPENIEAGKARQWQVHLHETPERTIPLLKTLIPAGK